MKVIFVYTGEEYLGIEYLSALLLKDKQGIAITLNQ